MSNSTKTDPQQSAPTVHECDLDLFIIIHDQDLVLASEREQRFANLHHYRYLFVGSRDVSRLEHLSNVIVARELPDNIESYPNLLSFTAWYAVVKNGLAATRWVTLLEYDVNVEHEFVNKTMSSLRTSRCLVGYIPFSLTHPMYLYATHWFVSALQAAHGISVLRIVQDYLDAGGEDMWTATTNASISTIDLDAFVKWFVPVSHLIRHDPVGAHVHERALSIYCMLNKLENILVPNVLEHNQERSHGIIANSWNKAEEEAERSGRLSILR